MDLNFDIDFIGGFDPEKDKWDALIEAAIAGNVVPVIGPDIICEYGNGMNINEKIISSISEQLHLSEKHRTFSQLVYDPDFVARLKKLVAKGDVNKDSIYSLVNHVFNNRANVERYFQPSATLKRLLNIKLFPFVITTSFAPVVENAMREIWGKRNVRVLSFCKDPKKDKKVGVGDIQSAADMAIPTVYYMFGHLSTQPHSYVLTDEDMLEFCQSWLSGQTRPENLCSQLKDKYLLMLGCGYSDWLFRFIWFCMNKKSDVKTKGLMASDKSTNETLVEYLRRIDTFLPANKTPEDIIAEIERRITVYNREHEDEYFAQPPKSQTDVFISYSRSDSQIAESLYRFLSDNGLNVWYDKNNLMGGSKFMDEIERAIENTRIFIPVLTKNIEKEAMAAHVYRTEWKIAANLQESMGNRNFIIPLHEDGFDFYSADTDIPKSLRSHNSVAFDSRRDFAPLLDSINETLNKLDSFKL